MKGKKMKDKKNPKFLNQKKNESKNSHYNC